MGGCLGQRVNQTAGLCMTEPSLFSCLERVSILSVWSGLIVEIKSVISMAQTHAPREALVWPCHELPD